MAKHNHPRERNGALHRVQGVVCATSCLTPPTLSETRFFANLPSEDARCDNPSTQRSIVLTFPCIVCLQGALLSQTEADWDWTNVNFGTVLDRFMPMYGTEGLYVVYRANRDLHTEVPEYWFLIDKPDCNRNELQKRRSGEISFFKSASFVFFILLSKR